MKELSDELKKIMDNNDIDHNRIAIELITPRGKAMAFLKLTCLTHSERREATKKLNAIQTSTGYVISPIEPREVQTWLPNYKRAARANIISALPEKGYRIKNTDISMLCK